MDEMGVSQGDGAPDEDGDGAKKRPVGRPSKYAPSFCEQARKLALLGLTDEEMANVFGVDVSTLYRWKAEHPGFREAINEGGAAADARVADRLYHRAMGYEHADVDIRVVDKEIVQTEITKYYPPDTAAAIFWLKNRQRSKWRDKVETGLTDKEGNDVLKPATVEDARLILFALRKGQEMKEKGDAD